ncbi:hypothetical protein N9578_01590 [bacterium]|nr:hypothetical protein [bacterium]
MTKKLEEEFDLPSIADLKYDPEAEERIEELDLEKIQSTMITTQSKMELSEKVDAALPLVDGMDQLEREMDEYARQAMETFNELVDLGKNVEDRHVAPIYDSASKMLTAGMQAKQAKIDKKLKMIELQMRKQKLDMQERELKAKLKSMSDDDDDREDTIEGRVVGDRSSMLAEIMANMAEKDK